MRRITTWVLATISGIVLLFSYHTSTMGPGAALAAGPGAPGPQPQSAAVAAASPPPPQSRSGSGGTAPTTPITAGAPTSPATAGGGTVVTGDTAETRRGPVQVEVHIQGGRIVDIVPLQLPHNSYRDERINARAVPILHQEALSAQSANIDTVSGATITSDGYAQSLQSALDAAHLGRS